MDKTLVELKKEWGGKRFDTASRRCTTESGKHYNITPDEMRKIDPDAGDILAAHMVGMSATEAKNWLKKNTTPATYQHRKSKRDTWKR